jgi:hypothetical protein
MQGAPPEDLIVRRVLSAIVVLLALPAVALADPSTSPMYTTVDQAQYAKLAAGNGKWTCQDTPASSKPDIVTAKQAGNWYVWSETGDQPSTTYVRWVHQFDAYVENEIDASGSLEVYTTKSADPFNATWKPAYPRYAPNYPFVLTLAGNVITSSGRYKDPKTGKVLPYKSVCTKG